MGVHGFVITKELLNKHGKLRFLPRLAILVIAWLTHWFYSRYDTLRYVSWSEFYGRELFHDTLPDFERFFPHNIIPTPENLACYPETVTVYKK